MAATCPHCWIAVDNLTWVVLPVGLYIRECLLCERRELVLEGAESDD